MLTTIDKGKFSVLHASEGFIHKIGSDDYAEIRQRVLLPGESASDFEEIDRIPPFTKAQYDAKVDELIRRRFSASEVEGIYRKVLSGAEGAQDELAAFNAYAEQCKAQAKDESLYAAGEGAI